MTGKSACTEAAWDFSRVGVFWERFQPLTPWGRDEKEARRVSADKAGIEGMYDDAEAALALMDALGASSAGMDRLTFHLKRMPRFPAGPVEEGAVYELVELFQVKKFIANYRAACGLVGTEAAARFGLGFGAVALASELDRGGSDAESFFIADAYDARLREARRRIAAMDGEAEARKNAAMLRAASIHGLDFGGRDFALVRHAEAPSIVEDRETFSVDIYDEAFFLVRLRPSVGDLRLLAERDGAAEAEKLIEAEVVARISSLVSASLPELRRCAEAVTRFDLALARAFLARRFSLKRPTLLPWSADRGKAEAGEGQAEGRRMPPLEMAGGVFLPCAWECERLSLRYVNLDFRLEEGIAVVFGSNMGGKTVALETALFFQVLAQAGFFVPATRYATSVYPFIHYVGESRSRPVAAQEGLSGFGFEIRSFVEAFAQAKGGAFLVLDEFARTTSSHEAEAILSAVIEALAGRDGIRALFSTHFRGLSRIEGVRYLRVRGLDREAASRAICLDDEPLGERIRRINGMMRYGLVDEGESALKGSDAVAIASLLGMDCGIVTRAEAFFAQACRDGASDMGKNS